MALVEILGNVALHVLTVLVQSVQVALAHLGSELERDVQQLPQVQERQQFWYKES